MRSFFKSELETLKIKRGLNQWENLSSMTNAEGVNIGEQSIKMFLDLQEEVCEEFKYIPDNDKKRIIQYGILHEPDFMQWTPYHTWKWLNSQGSKYFKEDAHKATEKPKGNATPVTYDQLSPEVRAGVDAFLASLQINGNGLNKVPEVTERELKSIEAEDEMKRGQTVHAIPSDPKLVIIHQKKMEAIRSRGLDKVRDGELNRYEIEGRIILARTREEAQEIYIEIYE